MWLFVAFVVAVLCFMELVLVIHCIINRRITFVNNSYLFIKLRNELYFNRKCDCSRMSCFRICCAQLLRKEALWLLSDSRVLLVNIKQSFGMCRNFNDIKNSSQIKFK